MPPPKPDAPGPFRLSAPGELERVIRAAGFEQVTVEAVPTPYIFESLDQHLEITADMAAPLKRALVDMPPATARSYAQHWRPRSLRSGTATDCRC